MLHKLVLFLLLICSLLAARSSARNRRRLTRPKTTFPSQNPQVDTPQTIQIKADNHANQQQQMAKQISFGEAQYISYKIKNVFLTFFYYSLAGCGVVGICYYFLRKIYQSEVDELCAHHQVRKLERKLQNQELQEIANGLSAMKRPEQMRCKLKHKHHQL